MMPPKPRLKPGAFTQPVRAPGTAVQMPPLARQAMNTFYAKLGLKPQGMTPQPGQVMPGLIKP